MRVGKTVIPRRPFDTAQEVALGPFRQILHAAACRLSGGRQDSSVRRILRRSKPEYLQSVNGAGSQVAGLIFLRQHDRDDALRDGRIGWVRRMHGHAAVIVDPMEREAPNRVLS